MVRLAVEVDLVAKILFRVQNIINEKKQPKEARLPITASIGCHTCELRRDVNNTCHVLAKIFLH